MKISCQSCGANYAIADHKVRGRLVKVRCKSCSSTILVDGRTLEDAAPSASDSAPQPAAEAPAPAPAQAPPPTAEPGAGLGDATDDGDDATRIYAGGDRADGGSADPDSWSVNLSDTDQRTMTTEEIIAGFVAGEVTDDAFVWREGLDDWQPVLDVPELRTAIESRQPPKSVPPEPAFNFSPPQTTEPDESPKPTAAWVNEAAGVREDLFGNVESAGSEAEAMGAEIPPEPIQERKIGARNENSVLFSLDSLKQGMAAAPPAAGGNKRAPKAPAPGSLSYGAASSPVDDLLGLGGGGGALFSADANAALLTAPAPEPPKPKPKPKPVEAEDADKPAVVVQKKMNPMVFVAIGGIMVVLVAGALVAGLMLGKGDKDEVAQKTDNTAEAQSDQGKTEDKGGAATDQQGAAQPTPSGEARPDSANAAAGETKTDEKKEVSEEDRKRYEEAQKKAEEEKAKTTAAGTDGKTEAKKDEKPAEKKEEKKEAAGGGGAPFNKGAAISALASAAAAASGCKRPDGPTGSGRVTVTFMPSGRATGANVSGGGFGGTSVGGCVASVFRRAKIPPFDGDPVTVSKSFTIAP